MPWKPPVKHFACNTRHVSCITYKSGSVCSYAETDICIFIIFTFQEFISFHQTDTFFSGAIGPPCKTAIFQPVPELNPAQNICSKKVFFSSLETPTLTPGVLILKSSSIIGRFDLNGNLRVFDDFILTDRKKKRHYFIGYKYNFYVMQKVCYSLV